MPVDIVNTPVIVAEFMQYGYRSVIAAASGKVLTLPQTETMSTPSQTHIAEGGLILVLW
jgi:hypothetical protein